MIVHNWVTTDLHTIFHCFSQFAFQIRKTKANIDKLVTHTSNQKTTEDRITMMVMSVVWLFVICNIFQFAYYQAFRSSMSSYVMFVLSYFGLTLNSSVNSVVYGIFSKKYRAVFLKHFSPKKPEQEESQMSSVTTKNTDMKNWIEFIQERLKDLFLKIMK